MDKQHGRETQAIKRPPATNEEILAQVQELLERPDDDLSRALLKQMLLSVLKFQDPVFDTLELKIVKRALQELRYAFRVFSEYRHRPKISTFGSARTQPDDPNYQLAYRFGQLAVQAGYMVVTGGADGIMRACQEGAGREESFGINILLPFEQGPNEVIADDPKLINFKYFFTRKIMFVKESYAIALFPGGFGTHDEGFEVLTLLQTGKSHPTPLVCLQVPGCDYWNHWQDFIEGQLLARNLINREDLHLFKLCTSEQVAMQEIVTFYRTYHSIRFVGSILVMRIKRALSGAQLDRVNKEFADLLDGGSFEQRGPLPEEFDEPALKDLPRLTFPFNRRSAGRQRQLIDHLNSL